LRSRTIRTLPAAGLLAVASLVTTAGGVAAYGHADQPLAQIEFSANCDKPGFALCAPPPDGFGLGGIWLWIEVDADGTGDVRGAGCGHTQGGGGGGGAGPIHGDVTWWASTGPQGPAFAVDPNNKYYNVDIGDEGPPFSFPRTQGHYSFHPAPGVTVQTTIAP
jgi:hypothetical protein